MKDISREFLIVVKYIIALVVITMVLISNKVDFKNVPYLIILFLLYVVSIQIRMFIARKKLIIFLSIVIDLLLGALMYRYYGGLIVMYYFIAIIDASIMLDKKLCYISFIFELTFVYYFGTYSYSTNYNGKISVVYNLIITIILMTLGRYIHYQSSGTKEAHKLYDELRRSEDELQAAYKRLEQYSNTVEELTLLRERNRISREIHDTVGHTLTTMIMELQALPHIIKTDEKKTREMIESMITFSKKGLEDVRRAVTNLKPVEFDEYAGIFAIKELIVKFKKVSECNVNLTVSKNQYHLTPDQAFILYRVIQESLNNAIKHGNATSIDVIINFGRDKVVTTISNNGRGCKEIKKGFGIKGMEERISKLNGTMEVYSGEAIGFEVRVKLPVQYREDINE